MHTINSVFNLLLPNLPACKYLIKPAAFIGLAILFFHSAEAQVSVLQRGYNPGVTGANLNETILTPGNVSSSTFGRIFSLPVDGAIYAQPLYVPNLTINGGTHNVVFVATMKNIVYAFDADTQGAPLWELNVSNTIAGSTPVPITDYVGTNSSNMAGAMGIESTPVINSSTNTIYFVTNTLENGNIVFRLHAADITTGAEKFGGPVVISGTYTFNGNTITFNPAVQNQRVSLTLANGQVIVIFTSHEDSGVYYGWVMSYNASTLALSAVFNPAPSNYAAGIWQSGRPPVVDSSGYVYLFTGNGTSVSSQPTADGVNNFAESVLKLNPTTLKVIDYFTPSNYQYLDQNDFDLSSSGPSLIPGGNVLIGGGKLGNLYLLNTQNLGKMQTNDAGALQNASVSSGEIRGGVVVWARSTSGGGPLIFNWGASDSLKAFSYNPQTSQINTTPVSTFSGNPLLYPGGMLALSANGDNNGIVWAAINSQGDADHRVPPGELRALNAANLSQELWNSTMVPARDDFGLWVKYAPPLIVNGKVYMVTQSNQLAVYGLLPTSGAATVTAWPPRRDALGGQANYLVSALSATGSSLSATWSVSGLPTGATGLFSTDSHGRTNLQVSTSGTTPQGTYTLSLTANVAGIKTNQTVLLNVPVSAAVTPVTAIADSQVSPHIAEEAIDTNISTFWKTLDSSSPTPYPHSIGLDLGSTQSISGVSYLPRQDGCVDGTALQYEVYLSTDNVNWFTQSAGGSFDYGPAWRSYACDSLTFPPIQTISFPATNARYVLLNVLGAVEDGTPWASASELTAYVANTSEPQVALSSSASSITLGQTVTYTVNVTGKTPTGTVQFYVNGTAYGSPVTLSGGRASITSSALNTTGTDVITASYSGDANNAANTVLTPVTETVTSVPVSVALSSSASTVSTGQAVTFTATVTGNTPTGTVQFYVNNVATQSPVTLSNGSASLATMLNSTGTDLITAGYSGDANNAAYTSSALTETVTSGSNSTTDNITLSSSASILAPGQSVTVTATVTGKSPTGTVQFYLNGIAYGSPVTLVNGSASVTATAPNTIGTDSVTASYSGDANNSAISTLAPMTEIVTTAATVHVPALPLFYQVLLGFMLFSIGAWFSRKQI